MKNRINVKTATQLVLDVLSRGRAVGPVPVEAPTTEPLPMLFTINVDGDQRDGFMKSAVHAAAVVVRRTINRAGWTRFVNLPLPGADQNFVRMVSKGVSVRVGAQYVVFPSHGESRMMLQIAVAGYK